MAFTLTRTVNSPFSETVAQMRQALSEVGFGVLTEIDLQSTFKEKLDAEIRPHVILGACRPPLAYQATQADPAVAALLPCNVAIRSVSDNDTTIEVMDPGIMSQLSDVTEVTQVAAEARDLLEKALATLP